MANTMARDLIELSRGIESRKAREEQKKFQEAYVAPLNEAYANYYNAMADKMGDTVLADLEKQLKTAQVLGATAEATILGEKYNTLMEMKGSGDPNQKRMANECLLGINVNQAMKNQLDQIRVMNDQLATFIQAQGLELNKMKYESDTLQSIIGLSISPEGQKFLNDVLGKEGAKAVKRRATERFTGAKSTADSEPTILEKLLSVISREDQYPNEGKFSKPVQSRPAAPQRKPAEITSLETVTEVEKAPIFQKADANKIRWSSVEDGIEELIQTYPELSKEDVISAMNRLAEGFTVEQIKEHYEQNKKKE